MNVATRILLIGLVATMMSGPWAADTMAQRDAGAKARGEFGKGNRQPSSRRSGGGSLNYYSPSRPRVESYRSYSYEPIGVNPGDMVVVKQDGVQMMKGTSVVGAVPSGLKFKVTKVTNGWLGTEVEVDGQRLNGWIWHKNVTPNEGLASASQQAAREDARDQGYRRFSYEPGQQVRSYEPRQQVGRPSRANRSAPTPPSVRLRPGSRR